MSDSKINKLFKPYLKPSNLYVGGKSKKEVAALVGDKKLYKLSSNENILGASPKALQAIKDNLHSLNEYPERTDQRLRAALADFYKGELQAEQFITAGSGSEVLELIIRAFLDEGLEYMASNPMFKPYQMFSDKMGSIFVDVPLRNPDYSLDIDGILAALTPQTRMLFLTSPNNPTGTYIPKADLDRLMSQIPDNLIVVLDEVYALFADAPDYTTAVPYVKEGKNIIGLNSFSKTFGLAGLRLGYAYSTPELADYVQRLYKPFMINTLSLEAAIAGLSDVEFLEKSTSLVKRERAFLYNALDRLGMHYWPSQANFILLRPSMTDKDFEQKILQEGIMVRPVSGFGAPGCVRVTVGDREANEAFIKALEVVLS